MNLRSLDGCQLAIGSYPYFEYDARGGGGKGSLIKTNKENLYQISFSSETFSIPPLTSRTTKFLKLPLPPGLKIEMLLDNLGGTINKDSGEILLNFESRFLFSIGPFFQFPDLIVKTSLKTGEVKSNLHKTKGLNLQDNGKAILVGIAVIPITGNKFLDFFLGLPNEALAKLICEIN